MEYWSQEDITPSLHLPIGSPRNGRRLGFALLEVMIGVAIFALGIVALGRAVENCINAGSITTEEERIRQILADQMAILQTRPGRPEESPRPIEVESGYGKVKLTQKTMPARLEEEEGAELQGIYLITLTAEWMGNRGRQPEVVHHVERTNNVTSQWIRATDGANALQTRTIEFYVYRQ
jgi:hypothetical protein